MSAENRPVRLEKPGDQPAPAVRASDADRDRVADILREALAEGRLDGGEHAERVDQVYRAKTLPELDVLIRDLPEGQPRVPPPTRRDVPATPAEARNVVAILGGATRTGNWRVGGVINVVAVCGGVDVDLTEGIFEQREVLITVTAICGGVDLKVPENVTLRSKGSGILGAFDVREQESADPGAPVITVQGVAVCGAVDAGAVTGQRITDLRDPDR